MADEKADPKQTALAAIEGLGIDDCLYFFHTKASDEQRRMADLVEEKDEEFERDWDVVSESDDNGCYVLGWRWASFCDTEFDKESDEDEDTDEENDEDDL